MPPLGGVILTPLNRKVRTTSMWIFPKNGFDILKKEHPGTLDPLFNPIVGGGGWSDGQGQKMKKVVEDKGYTFYFLALSLS